MLLSQGDFGVFFRNGLVASITVLAIVMLFWPLVAALIARIRAGTPEIAT
jgi:putative tricarboxylic transport membrane protein